LFADPQLRVNSGDLLAAWVNIEDAGLWTNLITDSRKLISGFERPLSLARHTL